MTYGSCLSVVIENLVAGMPTDKLAAVEVQLDCSLVPLRSLADCKVPEQCKI